MTMTTSLVVTTRSQLLPLKPAVVSVVAAVVDYSGEVTTMTKSWALWRRTYLRRRLPKRRPAAAPGSSPVAAIAKISTLAARKLK
jgi:hypothetical protein